VQLSVLYSQVLWAHHIEYDRKDANGGTDDISGVACRILCEGMKPGVDCMWRPRLPDLRETKPAVAPKLSPKVFERNLNGQQGHFTKIRSISKFNIPFSRTKFFVCVEISLYLKKYALLSRYHATQFAISLFTWLQNTEIYKNSTSDSVLSVRSLPRIRPWTCWGLPYSKQLANKVQLWRIGSRPRSV